MGLPTVPQYRNTEGPGWIDVRSDTYGVGRVLSGASLHQVGQRGDRFGTAIARADIDGDTCVDLVIGAPGVDGGGAVYVVFGAPAGQIGASLRIPFEASPGDAFGKALAVDSLYTQTHLGRFGRIWIGVPGRDVDGQANAGAVAYTEVVDRVASRPQLFTQNSPGVPGRAEPGDYFGEVLSSFDADTAGGGGGVVVGQPSEDIGDLKDAGSLTVLPVPGASPPGPGPYGVTQDTPGIPGTVEAGDRFGAAVDGGWVGVPYEDVGSVRDAGMVHGLGIGATKATSYIQLLQGQDKGAAIPGRPEAGDHFGASVVGTRFGYDDECYAGQAVIGVPGEDVGTTLDAGEADIYFGHDRDPAFCAAGIAFNLGANARSGDRLGTAVARQDESGQEAPDDLLFGVPGYDLVTVADAGVVLKVTSVGTVDRVYTLTDGAVSGARYGAVLSR